MRSMIPHQRHYILFFAFVALLLGCRAVFALEFDPGAGVGVEYTDNAKLTPDNTVSDVITEGFVAAKILEDTGPLKYDAVTSYKYNHYTQDTFADQQYFNLGAHADWEMIENRFNWTVTDNFNQRSVNTLDAYTPDNRQNSNAFTLLANVRFPVAARQSFSFIPSFSQYYYEVQKTDNKQYALALNWNYQIYRLTGIGINFSSRKIDYTERDNFGNSIADSTFTNAAFLINGQRLRSTFAINLGATNVKREGGGDSTGFAGSFNWLTQLTANSKFQTLAATDLTDTSRVVQSAVQDPINGNPDDVQIATDVIRNSVFNLAYLREDGSLNSRIWANYRKVLYSDTPQDRVVHSYGLNLNHPVTQSLTSGAYISYDRTNQLDSGRIDQRYIIGGNLQHQISRLWHSAINVTYRTKLSTNAAQEYNEFRVYASLVYGFGNL
jgi:hypothetical protein